VRWRNVASFGRSKPDLKAELLAAQGRARIDTFAIKTIKGLSKVLRFVYKAG
jgi:hypothetical protein